MTLVGIALVLVCGLLVRRAARSRALRLSSSSSSKSLANKQSDVDPLLLRVPPAENDAEGIGRLASLPRALELGRHVG